MKKKKKRAFTIIELMASIVIIAILISISAQTISGYITKSKKTVVINQCKKVYEIMNLRGTLEQFEFNSNEEFIKDIFEENGSFEDYDLINRKEVDKILDVKIENELEYIAKENFDDVLKCIELDSSGNFKKINN